MLETQDLPTVCFNNFLTLAQVGGLVLLPSQNKLNPKETKEPI